MRNSYLLKLQVGGNQSAREVKTGCYCHRTREFSQDMRKQRCKISAALVFGKATDRQTAYIKKQKNNTEHKEQVNEPSHDRLQWYTCILNTTPCQQLFISRGGRQSTSGGWGGGREVGDLVGGVGGRGLRRGGRGRGRGMR